MIDGGARIFVAGLGVPRDVIDLLHGGNVLVGSMCGKVRHAVGAVESGLRLRRRPGHRGRRPHRQVATMALVPQVVDAVGDRVPVVAAGGLFDGRGLAAALALGADGVWIGTRFIATPEARAVAATRRRCSATAEDGTVVSRAYTGKTCRVVRNDWTQHFERPPRGAQALPAAGRLLGRRTASTTSAGPTGPRSTCARSSIPAVRASAPSTSWCPPATWSPAWWPRPTRRSTASWPCAV